MGRGRVIVEEGPPGEIAVAERAEAMSELRLASPRVRAGRRFWLLTEWARGRSTANGNCEQHWGAVSGRRRS